MKQPRLAVVGAGYVGLVTGCCFSHLGYQVTLVESIKEKLELLKQGQSPIYEGGLLELLQEGLVTGRISFASSIKQLLACQSVDFIFLAVGTPSLANGATDTSQLLQAVHEVLDNVTASLTIIIKSTVPTGTAAQIKRLIREKSPRDRIDVVSNPEFLREGRAVQDFLRPDRIVIGADTASAQKQVATLYQSLERQGHKVILTTNEEAELAKYACNVMLASRITTMNQIARLCEKLRIDIHKIREIVGSDSRIGGEYLYAGLGYGGSCLPKDVSSFIEQCKNHEADPSFATSIHDFNEKQKCYFLSLIREQFPDQTHTHIGVLGLSFKAETDDVRESVALNLIPKLMQDGYLVKVHDPKATPSFSKAIGASSDGRIQYCDSVLDVLSGADILLILTEWQEYRRLTPELLAEHMKGKIILDGKNILDRQLFVQHGFRVKGVGWDT